MESCGSGSSIGQWNSRDDTLSGNGYYNSSSSSSSNTVRHWQEHSKVELKASYDLLCTLGSLTP
jgi:hypothetical protein